MNSKVRVIAFYLPQFHPFKENDEWWGKGFTEWTNVGRAKSLFKGHYQPRVPADLGYYDLRLPEVRSEQVELAKEAGISAFCYWHYWFGDGKQLMQEIFDDVLETGKPDFPFCLGWANHSWYAKTWDKDLPNKLLCEQTYSGIDEYGKHFDYALKAFKDKRYVKINGDPVFYIFDPIALPVEFLNVWQEKARKNGFKRIRFIARLTDDSNIPYLLKNGYDYLAPERMGDYFKKQNKIGKLFRIFKNTILGRPFLCCEYETAMNYFINPEIDREEYIIPSLIPQWDHSPRSKRKGIIFHHSSPKLFGKHIHKVLKMIGEKQNKIVFLKSWNEWAEGNYMEPDLKYGKGYIIELSKHLNFDNEPSI